MDGLGTATSSLPPAGDAVEQQVQPHGRGDSPRAACASAATACPTAPGGLLAARPRCASPELHVRALSAPWAWRLCDPHRRGILPWNVPGGRRALRQGPEQLVRGKLWKGRATHSSATPYKTSRTFTTLSNFSSQPVTPLATRPLLLLVQLLIHLLSPNPNPLLPLSHSRILPCSPPASHALTQRNPVLLALRKEVGRRRERNNSRDK